MSSQDRPVQRSQKCSDSICPYGGSEGGGGTKVQEGGG